MKEAASNAIKWSNAVDCKSNYIITLVSDIMMSSMRMKRSKQARGPLEVQSNSNKKQEKEEEGSMPKRGRREGVFVPAAVLIAHNNECKKNTKKQTVISPQLQLKIDKHVINLYLSCKKRENTVFGYILYEIP